MADNTIGNPQEFLDYIGPVTVDKTATKTGRRWSNTTGPISPVSKVNAQIHLPPFNVASLTFATASLIGAQFNFSVGQSFTLLEMPFDIQLRPVKGCICVRWRTGNTVTRYKLWSPGDNGSIFGTELIYVPIYTGQIIKSNCVFELWTLLKGPSHNILITSLNDIYFKTSILLTPNNNPNIESTSGLYTNLFLNLPVAMPMAFDSGGPFISN